MAGIGGTVANLLDTVSILSNELDVSNGGKDEARVIKALSLAQHLFETIAATYADVLQTAITILTAANTETTAWQTTLLRLDGMWFLDPTTLRQVYEIESISRVGGHVPTLPWPLELSLATGTGAPAGFYGNMANFYWLPLPDKAHNIRVFGFIEQAEFVNRTSDFNYPTRTKLPIATLAVRLLSMGVNDEDESQSYDALAASVFRPVLKQLRRFNRTKPQSRVYTHVHTT